VAHSQSSGPIALIVQDEVFVALDLESTMADLGYEVCGITASESKARALAMKHHPDIVLMDVCLSGGREGIETGRWLREVCGTSVVFVTSQVDADTVRRIHERVPGAPVVPKPFYRDRLAEALSTAVPHVDRRQCTEPSSTRQLCLQSRASAKTIANMN
jgi:DNA-binding NarL/FixJ family response regulator